MPRLRQQVASLRTSRQEKASGFLLAMLFLLGVSTCFLVVVWLSSGERHDKHPVARISFHRESERASGSVGESLTAKFLEDPGTDDESASLEQAAELLKAVSSIAAHETTVMESDGGSPLGKGKNGEQGRDGREKGPPGPDGSIIPPWERWQIRYSAADLADYAALLDSFQVELGVVGRGDLSIDYARQLSQSRPLLRQGRPADEHRLRFVFQSGQLKDADRILAQKSGISTEGRVVCQFFPGSMQAELAVLERATLGNRPLSSVHHTVFGVRRAAASYQFFVERVEPALWQGGLTPL